VARINNVPQSAIADALQRLIANGYINQTQERPYGFSRSIKVLHVNWEKCRADGIYTD